MKTYKVILMHYGKNIFTRLIRIEAILQATPSLTDEFIFEKGGNIVMSNRAEQQRTCGRNATNMWISATKDAIEK